METYQHPSGKLTAKVGWRIRWNTLEGEIFQGKIIKLHGPVALVKLDSGEIRTVELA